MTALGHLMNTSTAQAHLITSFGSTGLYISTLALALGLPPISSVKELAKRWRPEIMSGLKKNASHLAMDDIRDSIAELKYYREYFFIMNH